MKYLIFLILTTSIFAKKLPYNNEERIAQLKAECGTPGNSITTHPQPWVAYIPVGTRMYNPGVHVQCIGALISKRYVMTTSTCLQFVVSKVFLGEAGMVEDMVEVPVEKWSTYDKADIALFKLAKEVEFSDVIKPICLPFKDLKKSKTANVYDVTSWTLVQSEPAKVSNKIMQGTLTKCPKKSKYFKCLRSVGKHAACNGDEGSPIAYLENDKWILYGLLYNVFDNDGSPCAHNSPAVSLRITDDIVNWIVENINN